MVKSAICRLWGHKYRCIFGCCQWPTCQRCGIRPEEGSA